MILMRRMGPLRDAPALGSAPAIPAARPQRIPTLKMPTARGWAAGQTPTAAPGLAVNAFAERAQAPALDLRAAERRRAGRRGADASRAGQDRRSTTPSSAPCAAPRRWARARTASRCSRDADGDGVAETREVFLDGLNQPFGMALIGDTFYVGNTDGVVAFPYADGATRITAPGRKLAEFKPGGHWTRSLLAEPGRPQALRRRRLAQQHRRPRLRGGGGPRRDPRARPRDRRRPHLRLGPAQPGRPRLGADAPARSGPWSTSATASATRRRPTT